MSSRRVKMVAEELRRELAMLIGYELNQPDLHFITITRILPAADLKSARVYFTVLGDEAQRVRTEAVLKRSATFIQRAMSHRMKLRYTPKLVYFFDTAVEQESKMMKLLAKLVPGERREVPADDDAAGGEEE